MLYVRIAVLSILVSGCSYSYTSSLTESAFSDVGLADKHDYFRMSKWRLSPSAKVALKLAEPENVLLPRTTKQLNKMMLAKFDRHFSHFNVVEADTLNAAIHQAFTTGHELLVVASLIDAKNKINTRRELHYGREHHPEKDRGRDKLTLQLSVYDTQSHRLLDNITLVSKAAYLKRDEQLALHLIEGSLQNLLSDMVRPAQAG